MPWAGEWGKSMGPGSPAMPLRSPPPPPTGQVAPATYAPPALPGACLCLNPAPSYAAQRLQSFTAALSPLSCPVLGATGCLQAWRASPHPGVKEASHSPPWHLGMLCCRQGEQVAQLVGGQHGKGQGPIGDALLPASAPCAVLLYGCRGIVWGSSLWRVACGSPQGHGPFSDPLRERQGAGGVEVPGVLSRGPRRASRVTAHLSVPCHVA